MKTQFSNWIDLRGFRWRLEPLHRKLKADVDAARLALASLLRQEKEAAATLRLLESQFLEDAKAVLKGPLEPQGRTRSLLYLAEQGQALEGRRRGAGELRSRVTEAREGCMTAERRLAAIEKLRGGAEADFAAEQMRIAIKNADMAWLAGLSRQESAARDRSGT